MMRLRSSSRCCRRLIAPICRSSLSCPGSSGSATRSGIVVLWNGVLHALAQAIESALNGEILVLGNLRDLRLQMLHGINIFQLKLSNLFMDLGLELIAGFLEFSHELTPGTGHFRQLPGPEQDKGQKHN